MGKRPILVQNNGKSQRTILHAPGYALPETSTNKGQDGLTNFCSMFAEIFKEADRIHACPEAATPQKREDWTHRPCHEVATDTEESDSDDEESVIMSIIYPEDSNKNDKNTPPGQPQGPCETPSDTPSVDPTSEHRPPREKPTNETTQETKSDVSSDNSATTREGYMGNLSPG